MADTLALRRLRYLERLSAHTDISVARLDVALDRHPRGRKVYRVNNTMADLACLVEGGDILESLYGEGSAREWWHQRRECQCERARSAQATLRERWHSPLEDLLRGGLGGMNHAMDYHLTEVLLPPATPGANSDAGNGPLEFSRRICKADWEKEIYDQLQVDDLGWVENDVGHHSQFRITRVEGNDREAILTGVEAMIPTQDVWSEEWDALRKAPYLLGASYQDLDLHPYSPRLWGGEGGSRMLRHRLHPRSVVYLLDGLSYLRRQWDQARDGYGNGPFAQWWWLQRLTPPRSTKARERAQKLQQGTRQHHGFALRNYGGGTVPIPVWIQTWWKPMPQVSRPVRKSLRERLTRTAQ